MEGGGSFSSSVLVIQGKVFILNVFVAVGSLFGAYVHEKNFQICGAIIFLSHFIRSIPKFNFLSHIVLKL